MIQGPPGTGKTRVIGMSVIDCIKEKKTFVLTAETHFTVQVLVGRVRKDCLHINEKITGIFHVSRDIIESSLAQVIPNSNVSGGGPTVTPNHSPYDTLDDITDETRAKIIERLESHTQPRMFSLTDHIAGQMDLYLAGRLPPHETAQKEKQELGKLVQHIFSASVPLNIYE